jgi:hypothetical protein
MERLSVIQRKVIRPLRVRYLLLVFIAVMGIWVVRTSVQDARSCSVPVFRYALERWNPDPYKAIFIYRDKISEKDRALLDQLNQAIFNAEYPLNLRMREVDVATFSKEKLEGLLKGPIPEELPVFAVWYPDQMGKEVPLWTIRLTPSVIQDLMISSKRKQMAESLINGESVVWVFVPSGNSKMDEEAMALIRQELESAVDKYSKTPFYVLSGNRKKELTYGFPILTVSPDDANERFFLDMLLHSESDLLEYTHEPMVFIVFGRGRSLGCLFGEYITSDKIQDAIAFLSGACSCEVKALNPGMDLLLAAPWDQVVMDSFVDDTPLPELTGVMPDPPAPVEQSAAVIPEDVPTEKSNNIKKSNSVLKSYGIALGLVLAIVVFTGIVLTIWQKKD